MGGLFVPEAYITATRQYVAQEHSISLEELELSVNVKDDNTAPNTDNRTFTVSGKELTKFASFFFSNQR